MAQDNTQKGFESSQEKTSNKSRNTDKISDSFGNKSSDSSISKGFDTANKSSESKNSESKSFDAKESINHVKEIATDFSSKASDLMSDSNGKFSQYYQTSTGWISQNYGKTLAVVGAIAAVGLVGYYFNRRSSDDNWDMDRKAS